MLGRSDHPARATKSEGAVMAFEVGAGRASRPLRGAATTVAEGGRATLGPGAAEPNGGLDDQVAGLERRAVLA
jgi:hypothetical protein